MNRFEILSLCGLVFASSVQCASTNQSKAQSIQSPSTGFAQPQSYKASYLHFILGKLADLDSQPQLALEHYNFASHFHNSSDYLKMKQAEQLMSLGEINRAQEALKDLNLEDDAEYHLLQARVHALEFNISDSQRHMDKAIEIYSKNGDDLKVRETLLMKVALLSDSQRYVEAIKTLKSYLKENPKDEIAYYFLGKIHSIQNEGDLAIDAYIKAVDLRSNFTTASKALGLQYELAGNTQKAIDTYQKALSAASEDIQIRSKLANLHLVEENYRGALEHLYFLSKLDPSNVQTQLRIALIHFKLGDLDEAEMAFQQLVNDESIAHDRIYFYLGAVYEQKGDFEQASLSYQNVAIESPYFVESRIQSAFLLSDKLNQPTKAIHHLNEAVAAKPSSRELYLALASHHEQQNELAEAIRVLDKATRLMPKDDGLVFVLGTFLDRAGDFEAGIAKMRQVLELNPNHAHAMNHIGYVYAEKGIRLDEAESLLKKAVQLEPQNAYIVDSLGWLYFKKSEFKKAREVLERATKMEPSEPVIMEHLADVYEKLGLHELALEMYKKVVEYSKDRQSNFQSSSETRQRVQGKIAALSSGEPL